MCIHIYINSIVLCICIPICVYIYVYTLAEIRGYEKIMILLRRISVFSSSRMDTADDALFEWEREGWRDLSIILHASVMISF